MRIILVDTSRIVISLIIGVIVFYVIFLVLKEMIITLWTISPLTCIGFVVSIIIAVWKGRIRWEKGRKNLQIIGFIFVGTIISHTATSYIQNEWNDFIAGNLVGAGVMGLVILVLYFKGKEIQNTNP